MNARHHTHKFVDALTGSVVAYAGVRMEAQVVDYVHPEACETLFFPGCSLLNYSFELAADSFRVLQAAQRVEGISLLCCGKILSYEPDGKVLRAAFEAELREHLLAAGVKRIIAACPNCVLALRKALSLDERTASIDVIALPEELASLGLKVDAATAASLLCATFTDTSCEQHECADKQRGWRGRVSEVCYPEAFSHAGEVRFCIHDSCPDRQRGEFACGVRALMPEGTVVEATHNRATSFCCGSLLRAAGKREEAKEQACRHGQEGIEAGAHAFVTACMSCAYQLSLEQHDLPVFHYLELLFNRRIPWKDMEPYMKLRFLFEDTCGTRSYQGIKEMCTACQETPESAAMSSVSEHT